MAEQYAHHERLHLTNFTAFADCTFEFVPTINAFVGENGTGKTHLMKALYAVQYAHSRGVKQPYIGSALESVFHTEYVTELHRIMDYPKFTLLEGSWGKDNYEFVIESAYPEKVPIAESIGGDPEMSRPVFIPAIDMMGHTRRFVSTFDEYRIDFDQTYRDIVALLLAPERRKPVESNGIEALLISLMGGTVEEEAERFYLRTHQGRLPMPLVGEGIRKVATLYQLIRNGLLGPGSVLFWDEPEVNVNPKLMDEIVDVLLRLSRTGVQIFLATHSYVLLKELDLQARTEDNVRYFGLETTENGTVAHATDDYLQLHPNPIAEQFDSLYDRQLDRSLGRKRK